MRSDWSTASWGELIELKYGKALRDYKNFKGKFPVFGTNGPVGWCERPLCEVPGIIIGRKGAYRGVHFSDVPFFVIDTAYYVQPKSDFNIKWAYYHLLKQDINNLDSGSAIPSTSREDVYQLSVNVPPRAYQNAMVKVLDDLNQKIQLNHQINQTLEQMAQAIFKSWFVDFEPVKAKIAARERWYALQSGNESASPACYAGELADQPINIDLETYMNHAAMQAISGKDAEQLAQMQAEKPEEYEELFATAELFPSAMQDSELGEIPVGWDVAPIGQLCNVRKGLSYKGKHVVDDDSQQPMINLGNFGGAGVFKVEKLKRYDGDHKPRHIVSAGQLMVANTDMTQNRVILGSPILVPDLGHNILFTHHTFAVDFKREYPESEWRNYIFYWCLQPSFRGRAEGFATGTTVLALPKDAFLKCDIVMAMPGVVRAFNSKAQAIISEQDCLNTQISSLSQLRDTLLPKLLSGELSVADIESEEEA